MTLLAAADAGRDATGIAEQAVEAQLHERALRAARRELSDNEYADAFAAGSAMSLEEAVDFALRAVRASAD